MLPWSGAAAGHIPAISDRPYPSCPDGPDGGVVWLLTPKAGRDGHVEPSEVSESAPTAGLQQTSTVNAGKDWTGARLVSPRGNKKK